MGSARAPRVLLAAPPPTESAVPNCSPKSDLSSAQVVGRGRPTTHARARVLPIFYCILTDSGQWDSSWAERLQYRLPSRWYRTEDEQIHWWDRESCCHR